MRKVLGVVMILMALTLAIAPIFTDCESAGKMLTTADGRSVSMKCHWAGIAEIAWIRNSWPGDQGARSGLVEAIHGWKTGPARTPKWPAASRPSR